MSILVFLQGTILMPKSGINKTREERVRQSLDREGSVLDHSSYVPIGNAVDKLKKWQEQGVEILYFSSNNNKEAVEKDKLVLNRYNFPKGEVYFRQNGERYEDVVEKLMPNIFIEDDCESIGGELEVATYHLKPEVKEKVKSIIVKEFEGIDHLPDKLN